MDFVLDDLKDYHKLKLTNDVHSQIVKSSNRRIKATRNNFNIFKKNANIQQLMKHCWGHNKYRLIWVGDLSNDNIHEDCCSSRIARPGIYQDVGGVHLDKHVGGNKNVAENNLLTLWLPIVGFDERYTLRIAPGSHKSVHPDEFIIKNKSYISMTYEKSYIDNFNFIRPKLKVGQGIIFDPNLLHGASYNFGVDTRVSLEFRFFNAKTHFSFDG